jgi:putative transposase
MGRREGPFDEDSGYLHPCRYVLHDRDTKFCASFRSALGGVEAISLPARSPNLNAFAERWVRSVKQECLSKLILLGEAPLSRVIAECRVRSVPPKSKSAEPRRRGT